MLTNDPYNRINGSNWGGQSAGAGQPINYSAGSAFSGSDVRAFIMPTFPKSHGNVFNSPNQKTLDELKKQTKDLDIYLNQSYISNLSGVSLSTHRDKTPITSLGRIDPKGFVASRRTVAGSMVFWMSDASPISQLLSAEFRYELLHADEVPPFDLYLTFLTESDMWSSTVIYGITILDEGMVIENANGEPIAVTYSYMAMDCTPVTPGFFSNLASSKLTDRMPISSKTVGTLEKSSSGTLQAAAEEKTTEISKPIEKNEWDARTSAPEQFFTLTYSSSGNGDVLTEQVQTVKYLEDGVSVIAYPHVGYNFVKWSDDNSTAPKRTDQKVTANINAQAIFAPKTFTLTYSSSDHGSIYPTGVQIVNYSEDGPVIHATEDSGYHVEWSDGRTEIDRIDRNITQNITATATFVRNVFTFTYIEGPNGRITGVEGALLQIVPSDEYGLSVTASPNPGYHFSGWSDTGSLVAERRDVATGNITATANFVAD